jgi:hypothetical protein
MKFLMTLIALTSLLHQATAQANYDVEENKPTTVDGIEYGYSIKNETTKKVKGDEYSRFVITFYATNTTNSSKIYEKPRTTSFGSGDPNEIAVFNITNATGKRLTSKSADMEVPDFRMPVEVEDKDCNGKTVKKTFDAVIGYILRPSQSITREIIVIVPLDEKPVVRLATKYLRPLL